MNGTSRTRITGYIIFFIVFFILFIYTGFPVDLIEKRVISEIQRNSPYDVQVRNVNFMGATNLELQDMRFFVGNSVIEIDSLIFNPSVRDLLYGDMKIPFKAMLFDGYLTGVMHVSRAEMSPTNISLNIDKLDTSRIAELVNRQGGGIVVEGALDGRVNINLARAGNRIIAEGNYSFISEDMDISNLRVDNFTLPDYRDLRAYLEGTFDSDETKIEKLNFRNEDFELNFYGTMPPVGQLQRGGKIDLFLNLNLYSDEAKMSFLKAFLSPQNDGTLGAKIDGTMSNPRLVRGQIDF